MKMEHVCLLTISLHEAPVRKAYKSTLALVHFRHALDEMITTPLPRVQCSWK